MMISLETGQEALCWFIVEPSFEVESLRVGNDALTAGERRRENKMGGERRSRCRDTERFGGEMCAMLGLMAVA